MKKLMILGGGTLQIPLIKKCKEIKDDDVYVIVTDRNPEAPAFKYADEYHIIDATDRDGVLAVAKDSNIDGILTTTEVGLDTVSYVCEAMKLPGPSYLSAQISKNKYLMRKCMEKNKMQIPKCCCVHNQEELKHIKDNMSLPLVVKPTDVSGSMGVMYVETFDALIDAYEKASKQSINNEVIIEEYLTGKEYSVETLSKNGVHYVIAITEKFLTELPYFVEHRHVVPADLSDKEKHEIEKYVKEFLAICGFTNSAGHTELRMTKDGPIIIETGARIGGGQIAADLVPLATGISMHENIARIALGLDLHIERNLNRWSGVQFVVNENQKRISDSINELRKNEIVVRMDIDKSIFSSEDYHKSKDSRDRKGYFIGAADSRKELIGLLDLVSF